MEEVLAIKQAEETSVPVPRQVGIKTTKASKLCKLQSSLTRTWCGRSILTQGHCCTLAFELSEVSVRARGAEVGAAPCIMAPKYRSRQRQDLWRRHESWRRLQGPKMSLLLSEDQT